MKSSPRETVTPDQQRSALGSAVSAARILYAELAEEGAICTYPLSPLANYYPGRIRVTIAGYELDAGCALEARLWVYARLTGLNFYEACRNVERARLHLEQLEQACVQQWLGYTLADEPTRQRQEKQLQRAICTYVDQACEYGFLADEAQAHVSRHEWFCPPAAYTPKRRPFIYRMYKKFRGRKGIHRRRLRVRRRRPTGNLRREKVAE